MPGQTIVATSPTSVATAGEAGGHGFQECNRHLFGIGAQGEDVHGPVPVHGLLNDARKMDAVGDAELASEPAEMVAQRSPAHQQKA